MASGEPKLERDDDDPWSALPRRTGGLFWHATSGTAADHAARDVFVEWVRPTKIDKLVVKGLPESFTPDPVLHEGAGLEWFGIDRRPVRAVALQGELWSKPVRWTMVATDDETKRWAGLAFGSDLLGELTEREQMALALHGRVVSPVTSYLAIEPGVRPSTEGLESLEGGTGAGIAFGGYGSRSVCMAMSQVTSGVDRQAFLDHELGQAVTKCSATTATLALESTLPEIVDIHDVEVTPKPASDCVVEQLWAVRLPAAFTDEHRTWTVSARR